MRTAVSAEVFSEVFSEALSRELASPNDAATGLVGNSRAGYFFVSSALKLLLLFAILYGSMKTAAAVWALGDLGMCLMAWAPFSPRPLFAVDCRKLVVGAG